MTNPLFYHRAMLYIRLIFFSLKSKVTFKFIIEFRNELLLDFDLIVILNAILLLRG